MRGDGWDDIWVCGPRGDPAAVVGNPAQRGIGAEWERNDEFDIADGESPDLADVTGDGRPELLCFMNGQFGFAEIDWTKPASDASSTTLAKARFRAISPKSAEGDRAIHRYTHGYVYTPYSPLHPPRRLRL